MGTLTCFVLLGLTNFDTDNCAGWMVFEQPTETAPKIKILMNFLNILSLLLCAVIGYPTGEAIAMPALTIRNY
jgi:hypothetical protein